MGLIVSMALEIERRVRTAHFRRHQRVLARNSEDHVTGS
jgi:hypothetical protein